MKAISLDTTVVRSNKLLGTDLDDETVLISIEQGAYYGMEQTARRIWEIIATPRTVQELCRQLADEYAVGTEECQQDVIPFLEELLREDLIVVV